MVKVAIQQPQFLPWEGYWHKVRSADVFVFYGGVQYQDRNYSNRVKIDGTWMTLPVQAHRGTMFCDVMIDPADVRKLVPRLWQTYGVKKRLHPERMDGLLRMMSDWKSPSLLDFLVNSHVEMQNYLIDAPVMRVDTIIREGTPQEKMRDCLEMNFPDQKIEMLSSESLRGWYDGLVAKVSYQQKPAAQIDESFLARIVNEDVPDSWEGWSWT